MHAPEDKGARGRCSWIVNQLKDAPADLAIEAYAKNARTPNTSTLAQAREDRDALIGDDKREPTRFRLVRTVEMGSGRKTGKKSPGFIDSILNLIESFYGSVVQMITPWTPKAPKISAPPSMAASVDDDEEDDEPIDNPPPSPLPPSSDSTQPIPMPPAPDR